jgi:hypothetical protein
MGGKTLDLEVNLVVNGGSKCQIECTMDAVGL